MRPLPCCDSIRIVIFSVIVAVITIFAQAHQLAAQQPDGAAAAIALEQAFVRVIEDSEKSIVAIARYKLTEQIDRRRRFGGFPPIPNRREPGANLIPNQFGTGIIIAPENNRTERFILTNYHVVRSPQSANEKNNRTDQRIHIRLPDRRGFYAKIYAADPRSDLAVIKIDMKANGFDPAELKPLKLGDAGQLKKGKIVLALGNPYAIARDGSASASWGMISNISRRPNPLAQPKDPKETIHHFGTLLHVDTRLNLGTSGGALLNFEGELIGITTSLAAIEGYEKSVGYAVPVDAATRRIIETLMQGLEVEYGFLGVRPENVSPTIMRGFGRQFDGQKSAASADEVYRDTPAAMAGLRSKDVILAVNNNRVYDRYDLMREIGRLAPGSRVPLRVWRNRTQSELNLSVVLGKWPAIDEEGIIAPNERFERWRGLSVDYPTGRDRFIQYPPRYPHAVAVGTIESGSPAETAQLQVGDFITHVESFPVKKPSDFHKAAQALQGDVTLQLLDGRRIVVKK